jgi:hypothetical protein
LQHAHGRRRLMPARDRPNRRLDRQLVQNFDNRPFHVRLIDSER